MKERRDEGTKGQRNEGRKEESERPSTASIPDAQTTATTNGESGSDDVSQGSHYV
jgi:hypothetical protein